MPDIFTSLNIFIASLLLWLTGALGSLLFRRNDQFANYWGNSFAILGSVGGLISSCMALTSGPVFSFEIASSLPLLSLSFKVDKLSAFFIYNNISYFLAIIYLCIGIYQALL